MIMTKAITAPSLVGQAAPRPKNRSSMRGCFERALAQTPATVADQPRPEFERAGRTHSTEITAVFLSTLPG